MIIYGKTKNFKNIALNNFVRTKVYEMQVILDGFKVIY